MKPQNSLKIGIFGAVLTLIGDLLIGAAKFPEGANMLGGTSPLLLKCRYGDPYLEA